MRKIRIPLDDLLAALEACKEAGWENIMMFELSGYPAIADADDPDQVITFQSVNEKGELDEESDEQVH